jgi:cellulose synthase operon protein YhjU
MTLFSTQNSGANVTDNSNERQPIGDMSISMGAWSFYFLAKLAFFWKELIGFHPLENLAFAAFILLPVKHTIAGRVKNIATVPLAVALLYHDSWLPPISRAFSQASLLSSFSFNYLIELLARFFSLPAIAMLVIAWVIYWFISRWVRMGTVVVVTMACMAILQNSAPHTATQPIQATEQATNSDVASGKGDMDKIVQTFFTQEAKRIVSFPSPQAEAAPFDVIFIHICSLSWDDIHAMGLENHPLWHRFDFLFTHFNSASSYSGPAAIRIMRSTCGQSPHSNLYSPVSDQCYLMSSLKHSGFQPNLAMNHDGHFDDFLKTVQAQGSMNISPLSLEGATVAQHAFDDSPIYDDFSVLTRWLDSRQKTNSPRVALFYNTISLHDGNHLVGASSNQNSLETYKFRLLKLMDDMEKFMQSIEKSGRRAVVVMVPEHGAAVHGDKMQISGLREIPSPVITLVPVGIKVIGGNLQREGDTLKIDDTTSYLAVSQIVSRMLEKTPFVNKSFSPSEYAADLPITPFVSQNGEVIVAGYNHRYYIRQDETGWAEYSN